MFPINKAEKSSNASISSVYFEKAQPYHEKMIFEWLAEPHMQEFWDNMQCRRHIHQRLGAKLDNQATYRQNDKDDIICFIKGRKEKSGYFNGMFTYWVGFMDDQPFCFILTAEVNPKEECLQIWKDHMSTTGKTYSIDFGIGNKEFLSRGLASPTLVAFTEFFKGKIDPRSDTFFIDPDDNNPRAQHVYEKAGFNVVGDFKGGKRYGAFKGEKTYLMVKKI